MDYSLWLIIGGSGAIALYLAWSIGANDVANSMATAVGAKAITFKQAVIIAGILNLIGAVFVGSHVSDAVRKEIITTTGISNDLLLLGFIASLLAAALWVTLSTWRSMPISTTHSIIGALMGFGLIAGGLSAVNWGKVGSVAASWVLSPIAGCILAFFIFKIIVRTIFAKDSPVEAAKIVGPVIFGFTAFLIVSSLFLKTPLSETYNISETETVILSVIIAICVALIGIFLLRKIKKRGADDYVTVEGIFRKLQVGTSCYVAFAHGANDVANAIGPVAAIIPLAQGLSIGSQVTIPTALLALGGIGIAFGCMTWGRRVMETVGNKITNLTNTRGFSVDFGAATTVLICSKMGLPISTSHTVVGAVIGVGLARGLEAIDLSVIKKIVISWVITLPVAAGTSIGIFLLLRVIFG
ncbi:MAG: inorganic phosphate transporter [Candidatus Thermoplasmatota archaeon]|nr:inorganic phosphate transporter [Candidatus Thermoplasmatota archaeon]MBU1940943.1 inorganic phosphate transporter [Candidatus Thermoplasmatota archaeon]